MINDKYHKFYVNYSDLFPHNCRKPNILYTIKKHIEIKFISYLINDFAEEFWTLSLEKPG